MLITIPTAIRPLPFQKAAGQFFCPAVRESQPQRAPDCVTFLRSAASDAPVNHPQVFGFMFFAHPGIKCIFHERAQGFILFRITQVAKNGKNPVCPIPFFISAAAAVTGFDQCFHQRGFPNFNPGAASVGRILVFSKDIDCQFPGQGRFCTKQIDRFIHIV